LAYLLAAKNLPVGVSRTFEIGGPDVVTYGDLIREYARQKGLRRLLIFVPVLTPYLSGLWLALVTPATYEVGRHLIEQKAPLCLILYGSARFCFVLAWMVGDTPGVYIAAAVGVVIALLTPAFHHLTVEDHGDHLAIRFGPLPLFRRTIKYAEIEKVEVGRTLILDGWGIHYSVRGG
jgi:hypothetical protein